MKAITLLFVLILTAMPVLSQDYVSQKPPFTKEDLTTGSPTLGLSPTTSRGLLDPGRFSMQQSYSMTYFSSGNTSDMTGLYLNRIRYDFAIPLSLQVDVGYFHKPMDLLSSDKPGEPRGTQSKLTVPRVGLTYQPSEHFMMSFEYFNIPAGYGAAFMPYWGYGPPSPFAIRDARSGSRP